MEILLQDIARTLNASYVSLPGHPDESLAYAMSQHPHPHPHHPYFDPHNPRYRAPPPLPDRIPVDIGPLRIDDPAANMGPVHTSRGPREASSPYRSMPPILTPPRSLERQLA